MNWLEGFRRLKVLLQIVVLLALSFFAYEHWSEKPYFTKKLVYEEASFSSEEDKKSDEAYQKSLEKIGLKQKQKNKNNNNNKNKRTSEEQRTKNKEQRQRQRQ